MENASALLQTEFPWVKVLMLLATLMHATPLKVFEYLGNVSDGSKDLATAQNVFFPLLR